MAVGATVEWAAKSRLPSTIGQPKNSLETYSGQRFHLVRQLCAPAFTPCAPTPEEERWRPLRHQILANKFSDHCNLHQPLASPTDPDRFPGTYSYPNSQAYDSGL